MGEDFVRTDHRTQLIYARTASGDVKLRAADVAISFATTNAASAIGAAHCIASEGAREATVAAGARCITSSFT